MHLLLSNLTLIGLVNCKLHIVNILQIVTLAFSDFHSCNFSKWFSYTIFHLLSLEWYERSKYGLKSDLHETACCLSLSDQISWRKGRMNILTKLYYASQLICIQFQIFLCFILNQLCTSRTYDCWFYSNLYWIFLPYE